MADGEVRDEATRRTAGTVYRGIEAKSFKLRETVPIRSQCVSSLLWHGSIIENVIYDRLLSPILSSPP